MIIGFVGLGAVIGIIAFAQILDWLLKHYHDLTIAVLTGLMLGSLRKIWPWKAGDGIENIVPDTLSQEVVVGIGLMVVGVVVVLILEYFATKRGGPAGGGED